MRVLLPLLLVLYSTHVPGQSYNPDIDVQHYDFSLQVNDTSDRITGQAAITIKFKTQADSFYLDLSDNMHVSSVKSKNKPLKFSQTKDRLIIRTSKAKSAQATFTIRYEGIPTDGLIISQNK
ncbi:MAG TPA: hypothetical protein VHC48_06715, partial [Puia sp.]|nr:hypothetical protein [Puia sp.]